MNERLLFVLFAFVFVSGFLVVAFPVVLFVNQRIGRRFDEAARALAPLWQAEELLFAEDAVRARATWLAPLAVGVRWNHVDVRVTREAFYLVQSLRMFGRRIGQPILAFPQPGGIIRPEVAALVRVGWLTVAPRIDGDTVLMAGRLGMQRFRMRLRIGDAGRLLWATDPYRQGPR